MSRARGATRQVFEDQLKQAHTEIAERLGDTDKAWQFLSQIVGAMVLARGVVSEDVQDEILSANRKTVIG